MSKPKKRKPKTKMEFGVDPAVEPPGCPNCDCGQPISFEMQFDTTPNPKCMAEEFYTHFMWHINSAMGVPPMVVINPDADSVSVFSDILKEWVVIAPARLVTR